MKVGNCGRRCLHLQGCHVSFNAWCHMSLIFSPLGHPKMFNQHAMFHVMIGPYHVYIVSPFSNQIKPCVCIHYVHVVKGTKEEGFLGHGIARHCFNKSLKGPMHIHLLHPLPHMLDALSSRFFQLCLPLVLPRLDLLG